MDDKVVFCGVMSNFNSLQAIVEIIIPHLLYYTTAQSNQTRINVLLQIIDGASRIRAAPN